MVKPRESLTHSGVFFMQSLTYWQYQQGDRLWTKAIVVITTIMAIGISSYLWVSVMSRYAPSPLCVKMAVIRCGRSWPCSAEARDTN